MAKIRNQRTRITIGKYAIVKFHESECDESSIGKRVFIPNAADDFGSHVVELKDNVGSSVKLSPDKKTFTGGKDCGAPESTKQMPVTVYARKDE